MLELINSHLVQNFSSSRSQNLLQIYKNLQQDTENPVNVKLY